MVTGAAGGIAGPPGTAGHGDLAAGTVDAVPAAGSGTAGRVPAGSGTAEAATTYAEGAEAAVADVSGVSGAGDRDGAHGAAHRYDVVTSDRVYRGRIIAVRRDMVAMPDGEVSQRDVVVHPGAVGVVALDEDGRVVMVRQYRHPVGGPLWELPAGILDISGEPASRAAARELAEEANLVAADWQVLADVFASPGMTDEAYRLFLARGLSEVPASERHVGVHEEADMATGRVDLDEAVSRVFRGDITNAMAVVGVLAAAQARAGGFASLRPVDAPWPARPGHAG